MDTTNPKDLIGINKPNLNLVPPVLMVHAAKAMENGAKKFGPYNWRDKKVKGSIYVAAILRHVFAYMDGEEQAPDSGVHHLGHAAACIAILLDAKHGDNLIDDRPKPGPAPAVISQLTVDNKPANPV